MIAGGGRGRTTEVRKNKEWRDTTVHGKLSHQQAGNLQNRTAGLSKSRLLQPWPRTANSVFSWCSKKNARHSMREFESRTPDLQNADVNRVQEQHEVSNFGEYLDKTAPTHATTAANHPMSGKLHQLGRMPSPYGKRHQWLVLETGNSSYWRPEWCQVDNCLGAVNFPTANPSSITLRHSSSWSISTGAQWDGN